MDKDDEVGVVYECKSGTEVVEFLKHQSPDIIFLDINMPGLNGIEVATKLKSFPSMIIFSTAYDQYAVKAFELEAFDYLLKPFDDPRFKEVLQRAKNHLALQKQANFSKKFADLYQEFNQSLSPHLSEFVIREKGFTKKVKVSEVVYIEASSVYAILHLENSKVFYRAALNLLEQQLPPNFFRIHRSFIVNQDFVERCKYLNNSTYELSLRTGAVLVSSRRYREVVGGRFLSG